MEGIKTKVATLANELANLDLQNKKIALLVQLKLRTFESDMQTMYEEAIKEGMPQPLSFTSYVHEECNKLRSLYRTYDDVLENLTTSIKQMLNDMNTQVKDEALSQVKK